jgi:uncharacterized membrane-anchored protein
MPRIHIRVAFLVLSSLVLSSTAVLAQESENPLSKIDWQHGPCIGKLGNSAQIQVPEGFLFADGKGARQFLEATENIPSGSEVGVLLPTGEDGNWWVLCSYASTGYISDAEKDKLDSDAILKSLREGTEEANKERRKHGWSELHVVGWARSPFYDQQTNNLTWAIRGAGDSTETVNYSTRLLGRHGYMNVDLILSPEQLESVVPRFDALIAGFTYVPGQRYAEFRQGDKLAGYGLTALIAGGAGAVAMKSGLLAKFWKLIVVGFIALVSAISRFVRRLFGGSPQQPQSPRSPTKPIG